MDQMSPLLLEVRNVSKRFTTGIVLKKHTLVLHNISLKIHAGKTVGVVGDSGIGKTTLGKIVAGVESPTRGDVLFHGKNIVTMKPAEFGRFRRSVQMMFQNPESALNPRKTIETLFYEVMKLTKIPKSERRKTLGTVLAMVGLSPEILSRYPSELSGGQNQRVALGRVLLLEPEVIILDEPTSALDISVQAQILHLLKEIQTKKNLGYLFISHDVDVVEFMCDEVVVLDNGGLHPEKVKEQAYE
jgi:peptide/nickel transport system ATP-binding protein